MKVTAYNALVIVFAALLVGTIEASDENEHDQVAASFDRMLNHEPSEAAPAPVASATDTLEATINARLWTAEPVDQVVASFDRMLNHEPTTVTTQIVDAVPDPMQQMLNAALWGHYPENRHLVALLAIPVPSSE